MRCNITPLKVLILVSAKLRRCKFVIAHLLQSAYMRPIFFYEYIMNQHFILKLMKTLILKTSYLGEFSSDFCHLKTKVIINYTSKQRYNLFRYSSTTNFYINESSSNHFAVYLFVYKRKLKVWFTK